MSLPSEVKGRQLRRVLRALAARLQSSGGLLDESACRQEAGPNERECWEGFLAEGFLFLLVEEVTQSRLPGYRGHPQSRLTWHQKNRGTVYRKSVEPRVLTDAVIIWPRLGKTHASRLTNSRVPLGALLSGRNAPGLGLLFSRSAFIEMICAW